MSNLRKSVACNLQHWQTKRKVEAPAWNELACAAGVSTGRCFRVPSSRPPWQCYGGIRVHGCIFPFPAEQPSRPAPLLWIQKEETLNWFYYMKGWYLRESHPFPSGRFHQNNHSGQFWNIHLREHDTKHYLWALELLGVGWGPPQLTWGLINVPSIWVFSCTWNECEMMGIKTSALRKLVPIPFGASDIFCPPMGTAWFSVCLPFTVWLWQFLLSIQRTATDVKSALHIALFT